MFELKPRAVTRRPFVSFGRIPHPQKVHHWPKPQALARTLPHNLEAERSVLGAILIDNDTFNLAAAVIDPHAFFRDAHRRIFDRMSISPSATSQSISSR